LPGTIGSVIFAPYGVPKAVIFANVIKLPEESIDAMFVAPYLKNSLPPDSTIEKFVVASVVAAAAVVAVAALPPIFNADAVPVMFVPTKADGVPRAGVTSVGLVANTAEPVPVSSVSAVNS
jgi:hypothetical protein